MTVEKAKTIPPTGIPKMAFMPPKINAPPSRTFNVSEIDAWESFLRVAQEKSFVAAAKKLRMGAPLLTRKIQLLEDELGIRLFHRTTRSVGLTQDGLALLPKVKSILEDFENIEAQFEAQHELKGLIRITCVTAYAHRILGPVMMKFQEAHPNVRFDLDVSDRFVDLVDSQVDIAIRADDPHGADFIYKKLVENTLVVCASPEFLRKTKARIKHPLDLRHHPLLTLSVYGECKFIKTGVPISKLFEARAITAESGLLMTNLALQGAGIAIRSLWDVESFLKDGSLVRLLPHHEIESFGTIFAVITSNRLLAPRVRAFLDFLLKESTTNQ